MDWTLWVIWTAQALLWGVLALGFYYMAIRIWGVEKFNSTADEEILFEFFQERRRAVEIEHEKAMAYARGEIVR